MSGLFEVDTVAMWKELLAQFGIKLKMLMPVYFNVSGVGGYGVVFGNIPGMVLAHVLLILVAVLALIGLASVIKWLVTRRSKKMDPHEKWLKTGKI